MNPIKIGITGGIGSGKSVVSQLLQVLGVPVYDCDAESKRLTVSDPFIRQQLIALLGPEVYAIPQRVEESCGSGEYADIQLNKPLLANYLFASADHVRQINAIIHPRLKAAFKQWTQQHSACQFVAMESAILFEAGFTDVVDQILMVYAPKEIRIARAMQRDQTTRDAVESRIRQQLDDEEKRNRSHFVIVNDGNTPVVPQVLNFIHLLSEK